MANAAPTPFAWTRTTDLGDQPTVTQRLIEHFGPISFHAAITSKLVPHELKEAFVCWPVKRQHAHDKEIRDYKCGDLQYVPWRDLWGRFGCMIDINAPNELDMEKGEKFLPSFLELQGLDPGQFYKDVHDVLSGCEGATTLWFYGPSDSGKTTMIRILEDLMVFDGSLVYGGKKKFRLYPVSRVLTVDAFGMPRRSASALISGVLVRLGGHTPTPVLFESCNSLEWALDNWGIPRGERAEMTAKIRTVHLPTTWGTKQLVRIHPAAFLAEMDKYLD